MLPDLLALLARREDENLEFKEAKNRFDFEELVEYCVALANEGGGKLLLGVTDRGEVVGSKPFRTWNGPAAVWWSASISG